MSVVIKDTASGALQELSDRLKPGKRRGLMAVLGKELENGLHRHFRQRDMDSPNKKGWARKHFWSRIRKSTAYDPSGTTDSQARAVISDPALAAHAFGATIRPAEAKMLAIPIREAAYGVLARSGKIEGLKVLKMRGALFLGRLEGGAKHSYTLYYRLVRSVTIPRDPRALPDPSVLMVGVLARAKRHVVRQALRGGVA